MRIITPDGSSPDVLTPNGYPDSGGVIGSTIISQNVAADFSTGPVTVATIPADGKYQFSGVVSFRNGTADAPPATFIAEFTYTDGTGVVVGPASFLGITGGLDQAHLVAGNAPVIFNSQSGTLVTITYGATGITSGSVDVTISVTVIRLA